MTAALIILAAVLVIALGLYAVIMWLTGKDGPCEIVRHWDREQGR